MVYDYVSLQQYVETDFIPRYKELSLLSKFPHRPLPRGIADNEVILKFVFSDLKAALHGAGFQPNEISAAFESGGLGVVTVDQRATLDEQKQAFFAANGILDELSAMLPEHVAFTGNTALMFGKGGNQESYPLTQYNFILDVGTSNGTVIRPLTPYMENATAAWSSFAQAEADVSLCLEALATVYPQSKFLCLYPAAGYGVLNKRFTNQDSPTSILQAIERNPWSQGP